MKWSYRLGRLAGIDVRVHVTFFLLIAWIAWAHWESEGTAAATLEGVAFILALFACIVAHEYGHALTARRYGIRTRDITLLPIGGVARLERMPDDPREELLVAVAGPVVSLAIAAVLYGALRLAGVWVPAGELTATGGPFLQRLALVNVFVVVFNLIPAFPMDGGRMLRALLALRMPYARATRRAASIGQAIAFLFGIVGLLYNPFLILIALFVWMGAAQEASVAEVRFALAGIPVSRLMLTDFETIAPTDPLRDVVQRTLAGDQKDFPVVESGRFVGLLTQIDLLRGLRQLGPDARVGEAMDADVSRVAPEEPLAQVVARLQERGRPLPVTEGDRVVGLLSPDNLSEYLRIQSALTRGRDAASHSSK